MARIVKASYPGHVVDRPPHWLAPYVFASPHSGREYPERFMAGAVVDLAALRRSEDAYVDLLLPSAARLGVPILSARFPRAFVDVNRAATEMDVGMFTAPPLDGSEVPTNRVLAGFGVIPRLAAEGRAIYARKLSAEEARARLRWCHTPYHEALRALLAECHARFGMAVLVDWHSMPSSSVAGGGRLADIVLGDRYGAAADSAIVDIWARAFASRGLVVSRNTPYAGGHVAALHGDPLSGVHVLQVEINRALYLDEARVSRAVPRFHRLKDQLLRVIDQVLLAAAGPSRMAAE